MPKYYALAANDEGEVQVIVNLPESRIEAVNIAMEYCNLNKLKYNGVRPLRGTERQNDILTKTDKRDKRKRKLAWF